MEGQMDRQTDRQTDKFGDRSLALVSKELILKLLLSTTYTKNCPRKLKTPFY
jgi:hypothetical protein